MAAVTICSDFGAPKNKVWHCFHCFPIYFPWSDGTRAMIFVFWMLSIKPTFSLSSFTFTTTGPPAKSQSRGFDMHSTQGIPRTCRYTSAQAIIWLCGHHWTQKGLNNSPLLYLQPREVLPTKDLSVSSHTWCSLPPTILKYTILSTRSPIPNLKPHLSWGYHTQTLFQRHYPTMCSHRNSLPVKWK